MNSGDIGVSTFGGVAHGIRVRAEGRDTEVFTFNSGLIRAMSQDGSAFGIRADAYATGQRIGVGNAGNIEVSTSGGDAQGIVLVAGGENSRLTVANTGVIGVNSRSGAALGIDATGTKNDVVIDVLNTGNITVHSDAERVHGIRAISLGFNSVIGIRNSGIISVETASSDHESFGIRAAALGSSSPIFIANTGTIVATGKDSIGVNAFSADAGGVAITNIGSISASSNRAIDVKGLSAAQILNSGRITGFVSLTERNDLFENRSGGVFETKSTTHFGGGNDLFINQTGATVLAATDPNRSEHSRFEGLETFRNSGGVISLADGAPGDTFTIANMPGEADLTFEGGGVLIVDAQLGGQQPASDTFVVDGEMTGKIEVVVNNTSSEPGAHSTQGIEMVVLDGGARTATFQLLHGPIDAGFFNYDLFFDPTGSGVWELRSFVGASAYALPKLLTAAQDLWHQTSATWFDRTADLRVILQGGEAPAYYDATRSLGEPGQKRLRSDGLTLAVWMKGGGSRLDRDGSATTSAYGRTYNYDLDNEFSSFDLQVGVDMGQYDVLSQGDVLIFGVLGGFVGGKLDYDSLADTFDFSGGQVGAYATYLNGGLFVDTLLNVHLYEINTPNLGFSDSLDATTV
ncbi:MAG: autotransporter outer membrane beta-barrel domain-containing protein, partial [Pseudomonadota bacterium]